MFVANNKTTNSRLMVVVGDKVYSKDGKTVTEEYKTAIMDLSQQALSRHKDNRFKNWNSANSSYYVNASKKVGRTSTVIYYTIEKNVFDKDVVIIKVSEKH